MVLLAVAIAMVALDVGCERLSWPRFDCKLVSLLSLLVDKTWIIDKNIKSRWCFSSKSAKRGLKIKMIKHERFALKTSKVFTFTNLFSANIASKGKNSKFAKRLMHNSKCACHNIFIAPSRFLSCYFRRESVAILQTAFVTYF